ncbi:hypothetical protein AYO44_12935 [Planctomycetaceae bacterium SCGC AG-212-F19]|nr:hypothetical protein AYO44_12935 [Planctomycetaceae bacterium SCGC AG-212-F19]
MTDYQIQANTRRCAATGRDLRPGESIYSVLLDQAGKLVRHDYALDAWPGPPAGAFSFWRTRVPMDAESRRPRIDDELLLDCLLRLEGQGEPERIQFRYIVALLLLRRKRLKFEDTHVADGVETLRLRDTRTRRLHEVVNPRLTDAQMAAVQDEVFRVLGWQ